MTDQLRALQEEFANDPDNREVLNALTDQLWQHGKWRTVFELYQQEGEAPVAAQNMADFAARLQAYADTLEPGEEKGAALLALGDIYHQYLGAHDEGMNAYQAAIKAHKEDLTPLRNAAAIYAQRRDWEHLLMIFRIERKVATAEADQAAALLRTAQVQAEFMQDFEGALTSLGELDGLDGSPSFAEELYALYEQEISVEAAIRQALAQAEEALNDGPAEVASAGFITASQLEYERYLGSPEEALSLAKRALEVVPDDEDARLIVEVLRDEVEGQEAESQEAEGQEAESQEAEGQEAESQQAESQEAESQEVNEVPAGPRTVQQYYDGLRDFDGDLAAAKKALAKDRANTVALKAVRHHHLEEKDMAGLVAVLEDSVRYLRKKEGEWEVMTELANLYWLELSDDEQAEYYFKRLKLLDAEHPDVYKFYEAYYEAEGEWRKLYTLMASRLEHLHDREEYRIVAERLAQIAEGELGSPEKAIDVWKIFLRQFSDDEDASRRLRHLYEDHGKWNALVDLLKEEVRQLADDDQDRSAEQVTLLEEMAHIYRTHLNLDTMVMNIMGQILELDPRHPSAFAELRELYASNRRFNDLADLLSGEAERAVEAQDMGMAVGYLLDVADIWEEQLNNQTQAIPFLERIVEIAPEEVAVRDRLREIYEKRRDFKSLFDLRLHETKLMGEVQAGEELRELLELSRERLRDAEREAAVLRALLEGEPDNRQLLSQLQEALERSEDWEAVVLVVERRASLAEEEEALKLFSHAARLYQEELHRLQEAARLWREVLRIRPQHDEAFASLARIIEADSDFDALQQLYLDAGQAPELFERLGELAELAPTDDAAAALERQRATLADEILDDPRRVIDALENLSLRVEPSGPVQRELLGWYRRIDDVQREVQVRTALLDDVDDGAQRFEEILEIVTLEESREHFDSALAWALKAFAQRPGDKDLLANAEILARRSSMLEAFVQSSMEVAEDLDIAEDRETIWAASARIYWQDLDKTEEAIHWFEILRDRHPQRLDILQALDDLYDRAEEPQKRIQVLKDQIEVLTEEGAADIDLADQLSKIADIQRTHLDDGDTARQTYSQILDLQPDHLGAIRGLKELYRVDEQWMDVVDCLLREIPLAGFDSQQAQWNAMMELAELYRNRLDDLQEALYYYGQVLGENPEHQEAVEAVRQLLAEDELARDAAMLLEPILRDLRQSAPLAEALEARLRVCTDPFEEQEILDELIPLYADELDDRATAFEHATRQFEIDPERDDIWLRVEQLGASLNRWEVIEEIFTRESPLQGHESPTRYDLLRHLAAIREHQLQKTEEALEAWELLHQYDPLDLPTLEALERLYRKTGDLPGLVRILRERARLVDVDEDRVKLLVEAGMLLAQELNDDPAATDVFQHILAIDPDQEEAVEQLEVLLRRQGRWLDLDTLLSDQAEQTIQPERRRYFLKALAVLRQQYLDDLRGSVTILGELLEDDPGDDEMLDFARRLDLELAEAGSELALRLDLARMLEPIYRMRGEYDRLDELLNVRLQADIGEFERLEILDELVELRQKRLSDPQGALDALGKAVIIQPDNEERRQKLLELANGVGRLEEGAQILEEAADDADPFIALEIWKRLGRLASQKLDDPERAIAFYQRAYEIDEADADVLVALERLFEATNQPQRLCENLDRQARFADPDRRLTLLRRIGTLQDQVLNEPVDAAETYRQILEMEPDDLPSIEALERLYRAAEQYFELVELWRRKVEIVEAGAPRLEVLQQWANIAEEELGDMEQARQVYERMLLEEPEYWTALRKLDRILEAQLEWMDWADVARRRLTGPAIHDPDQRLDIELRLARVLNEELFESEQALAIYRDILARHAHQPDAVAAIEALAEQDGRLEEVAPDLEKIYREQERWEDLLALSVRRREQALDPLVKAAHFFAAGELQRDHLQHEEEAMRAFAQAWRLDIDEDRYRDALMTLASTSERFELLVELLGGVLEMPLDPDLTLELHLILAGIWRDVLDDVVETEGHLREVLVTEPLHREAFASLRELLVAQARWHDLIDLLERRHDAVSSHSDQEAMQLLLRIAEVQAQELDDGFSAVETFRRILVLDERHGVANERIEALLAEQERWEDLADFYEDRADRASLPSEVLDAELALAELCRGPLMQVERAVELYGKALAIDAEHQGAIDALEKIFADEPEHRSRAGDHLEHLYRSRQNIEGLARVLDARAQASQDRAIVHQALNELAHLLHDFLDEPAWSWAVLAQLFTLDPEDELIRHRLWRLTARASAWRELTDVYQAVLDENPEVNDTLRARLHVDRALIFADRLDDLEGGRDAAEAALRMDPNSKQAMEITERLLTRQKAWIDLADYYRNRADYEADEVRRRAYYEQLASLYEDVIGDIDATVDVYARLLELAPGEEEYRSAMERILGSVGRWYDLADIYRQRIAGALDPDVVQENQFALAVLLETELNSLEEAVDLYRQILQEDRNFSDATRALEGLRRDLASRDGDWDPIRWSIIEILLESYEEERNWQRIDDLLDEQAELATNPEEQVGILVRKARLLLRSSEDSTEKVHALTTLAQSYCLDPTNDEIAELIQALADELDAWERVVPIYLSALGKTDDVDRQGHILSAIAQIYEGPIGDIESAIAAYQQSVEISAESEIALEKLQELYGVMEKWQPLVHILEKRLEVEYAPDMQWKLRKRIARIYDEILGDSQAALVLYEEIRLEEPEELSHLVVLERLYEDVGDFVSLEELLLDKLQIVDAEGLRARILKKLAILRRDHLERIDDAIACFHDVLSITPDDVEVLEALTQIYRSEERWHDLLEVLQRRRDLAEEIDEANEFEVQMGDILQEYLHDSAAALTHYRSALERDSGNYQARGALFRALSDPKIRPGAAEILIAVHRQDQEWDDLEALYERLIELCVDDREHCAQYYLDLATLQREVFELPVKAFATLARAMRDVPEVTAVRDELEGLAVEVGFTDDLVAIYEEALQAEIVDPEVRRSLTLVVASGYAEELGQPEKAVAHFEALLTLDEFDADALNGLDKIYQAQRDWENLARILENKLAIVSGDDELQTRFQLGYLREVVFEDHQAAFEMYRHVLLEVPAHPGSVEGLERLCEDDELRPQILEILEPTYREELDWAKLVRLFSLKLEDVEESPQRAEILRQMAMLQFDELEDTQGAFSNWCEALRHDPHDVDVQERLETIADSHQLHDRLVALYTDISDDLGDPIRKVELAEKAGRWALDTLGDSAGAAILFRQILAVDPEHHEALKVLENIARVEGDDESLAAVLAARVQSTFEPQAQIALYSELASVRMGLTHYDGAIEAFQQLLILEEESQDRLETLAQLFEITERWKDRVDMLERLLAHRREDDARLDTFVEIGTLSLEKLQDYPRARRALEEALTLSSQDPTIMRILEDVYAGEEDWQALQNLLEQELELVTEDEEQLRLFLRRAQLRYEVDQDVTGAIEDYQRAFAIRDDHPDIIAALGRLYRGEQRWEELLQLLTAQVEQCSDNSIASGYLLEMAVLSQEELGDLDMAMQYAEAALEFDPENAIALERLEAVQRARKDWYAVVALIDRRLDGSDAEERAELLWKRARTLEDDAGDIEAAASTYQRLLDLSPQDDSLIRRLESIYESLGDGQGLYALLQHRARFAEDDEERALRYIEMGEVARKHLPDQDLRIEALEAARQIRGDDDLEIVEPLLDAYIEGERFDHAEPLLEAVISSLTEARKMKEAVRFYHLRGKLAQQQGDLDAARKAFEEAQRLDATYIPNLLSLGKLSFGAQDWEHAKKIFQILLLHQMNIKNKEEKVEVYYHLGAIREVDEDERGARDMYKRALRVDPDHKDTKAALAALDA